MELTNNSTSEILPPVNRVDQMAKIQGEAIDLFARKNADYGDAFAEYGAIGVLVRIEDKLKRLMSISNRSIVLVNDETIRDTLIDLHNYSAMAIMLLDNPLTPLNPKPNV